MYTMDNEKVNEGKNWPYMLQDSLGKIKFLETY